MTNITKTIYYGGAKATGCKSDRLGPAIRYHRLQNGLSQQQLANGICSLQMISAVERGRQNPSIKTLEKIADRLNVPLHEIYTPDNDDFPIRVKLELAEAYIRQSASETAAAMLTEIDADPEILRTERLHWYLLKGELLNKTNQPDQAVDLLLPVIDEVDRDKKIDDELLCKMYNQLGTGYFKLRYFTKAYSAYKRGYQVAMSLPAFEMPAANVTYNLGITCNQIELWDEAFFYVSEAKKYYDTLDRPRYIADSYFELAIATKNEEYVKKALVLYESLEIRQMSLRVKQFHAVHLESKQDYIRAAEMLVTVAKEFVADHEISSAIFVLSRAALLCVEHSDLPLAQKHLHLATDYLDKASSKPPYHIAIYFYAVARVDFLIGNIEDCILNAKKSSDMYATIELFIESANSLELIADALTQIGQYQAAYESSKQANTLLRLGRRREQ